MGAAVCRGPRPRQTDRPSRRKRRIAGPRPSRNGLRKAAQPVRRRDSAIEDLAAAYAFGLVKAHAFVDGNKRTALVTALTFLRLNGYGFRPETREGVRMVEGLASSEIGEPDFARWLGRGMKPLAPA
jgi:death-on-curing protein